MSADDAASLLYLGLLLLLVAGSYLLASRGRMGQVLTQAAIWVLIFLGAIAAFGLWPEIRSAVVPNQQALVTPEGATVTVPRAMNGHYYLTLEVNGAPVVFTVDTGATDMVLSRADARAAGIDPEGLAYLGLAGTANGQVRTARVHLDTVALDGLIDRDVPAVVTDGELESSLLGMTYLDRFARLEIANGELVLTR
ncbi:retropepsin-like aspartic protease family protein [Rubellimicrobium aerolatum]|uniref:TIGR02281 family clan AA aspartic protease n=1 Tax=Rubellimicrobium aerolatum TaxID=490979 RepID=A0ABW0SGS8_9RHOB|nr:TIGR02281 family clan AA aspartic protease [Rubellimicrobium aerolatum]MBP1807595.1 aspartyl protease family protein [Rubellimicrobium aerolatum]